MKYSRVQIAAIGYELAPMVVTSEELEAQLSPVYEALHIQPGQLEALTGIAERRWWPRGHRLSDGAIAAARKALAQSRMAPGDVEAVVYTGVGRDNFEPATACRVASELGIGGAAFIFDISNACLGVLNGMLDVANRIELGQIRAGLVVSCETARDIVEETITYMRENPTMDVFVKSLATMTGGSGAVAVLLTDGSFGQHAPAHTLRGGTARSAPEHHGLCHWGLRHLANGMRKQEMMTDAVNVLKYGVELGVNTWKAFLTEQNWTQNEVDKVICHQVGQANKDAILKSIGVPDEKDFVTYPYLGNMGTVSLPITTAIAAERGFLNPGDRVGLLGIGSGLNCMMIALEW